MLLERETYKVVKVAELSAHITTLKMPDTDYYAKSDNSWTLSIIPEKCTVVLFVTIYLVGRCEGRDNKTHIKRFPFSFQNLAESCKPPAAH